MIPAADIGGTNKRIAFFEVEQRRLKSIREHVHPSREFSNVESVDGTCNYESY